ncbi:unnamed protein product [Rotaria sp. Silwood2]|nr:unnamed protein product [Rotaria sp. Silwood2]
MVIKVCETINSYLALRSSGGLNKRQLRSYVHFLDNLKYSERAKAEGLKSIVLTIEKNKDLPEFVIERLPEYINRGSNKVDILCILIIEILSGYKIIKAVDKLSEKLLEDWVLVRDDDDISFEHSSQEYRSCQSVSSIVAKIFVNSLRQNAEINDKSIENLVKAIDCDDRQTCILSAKALYLASERHTIRNSALLALREHVDSNISDVSVYSTVAYARGLRKLSSAKEPIMKSHIDFLSNIYEREELQLEAENFTVLVNTRQKGKNLPEEVIHKILQKFLLTESPSTMHQYLPFICSIIDKNVQLERRKQNPPHDTNKNRFNTSIICLVQKALVHALKTNDPEVILKSISGFKTLISLPQIELDQETIELLLQIIHNNVCNESITEGIGELLKRSKLEGNQEFKLATILDKLLDRNWPFEYLNDLFKVFTESNYQNKVKYFVQVLKIVLDYKISLANKEKILIVLRSLPEEWPIKVYEIAIEESFSNEIQQKNSQELVDEFIIQNSHFKYLTTENLVDWIERIKNPSSTSLFTNEKDDTGFLPFNNSISMWTEANIQLWANLVKKKANGYRNQDSFIIEALTVIKRATLLDANFNLTDTQILSCLVALNSNNKKGRLLQVATGEGKSIIVSVLAVFHALKGKKVDIITSSPVLAERDAKEKAQFYKMFGFDCSHNNDKAVYLSGPKVCYKKDIVYGEVAQFQFDTLRTEYAQLNTLGERKCDIAIVDEVDVMLIDDSSKIARLATTIAGMDQLQIIYHLLWNQLLLLQNKIIQLDGKTYLFYGKIKFEQNRFVLESADDQGDIFLIKDLKAYLASVSNISHIGLRIPDGDEFDKFIENNLDTHIRKIIKEKLKIPKNFENFVDTQIPKWINSAIIALVYQENVHYIVDEGLIKPVDYNSTGVVQSSSNWSDGLHQFLQLKHNLKMTSETFTTNFLSNVGYFKKYGSNLLGFTGTLGSERAKQVLENIYNVDLAFIPSQRRRQYVSFSDIILSNDADWLEEICNSAINESNKERGTLIICETIDHCKIISEELLKRKSRSSAIKLYTMNNMNQEQNIKVIYPGEIIVATNLAGRGTDIKTDEIEKQGGLHVIVTFMPTNRRVEEQALGRTSRQGKRGTSQKILNAIHLIHYKNFDIDKITQLRDGYEKGMLDDFEQNELKVINLKDELFKRFCSLLYEIRMKIRKKTKSLTAVKDTLKDLFKHVNPSVVELNTLLSIEEQWAVFLRKIDNAKSPIDCTKIHSEFDDFSKEVNEDYEKGRTIKNPYYHVIIGNDLVINDSSFNSKYDEAMEHFDRAIELDRDHCAAAFVGKGSLLLKGKERIVFSNQQELGYKDTAIGLFESAREILIEEMDSLKCIHILLANRCSVANTPLYKQLFEKSKILATYCNHIKTLIDVIRKSQRIIQIREIIDYSNQNNHMLEETRSHEDIVKGSGTFCEIRLIPSNNTDLFETAVRECKEIIIKKTSIEFIVIFRQKNKDELSTWKVDNSELKKSLESLSYNGNILDRKANLKIYKQIYEKVLSNKGCIQENFPSTLGNLPGDRTYEVTFNNLTVRKDIGTIDQALQTIDAAVKELRKTPSQELSITGESSEIDYQQISITLLNINADTLKQLFDRNVEIPHATKETALKYLKDKSSIFHSHLLPKIFRPDSYQVDLDITRNGHTVKENRNIQVKEAIEIIKNRTQDKEYFSITFLSANDISNVVTTKVMDESLVTAEFTELNGQDVNEVAKINSESINLEIFDKKEQVLKVIRSVDIQIIEMYSSQTRKQKFSNKIEAESTIQSGLDDTAIIILIGVSEEQIKQTIAICPDATFNIRLIKVDTQKLLNGIDGKSVNIYFDELKEEKAKILIEQIRKVRADFSLTFKKLEKDQVISLIEKAPIDQEDIQINKTKNLRDMFMNDLSSDLELSEFSGRGIEYLPEINEKSFIPWISISILFGIASAQMAMGGFLVTTGLLANPGMSLITEGGADFFNCYRAYSTRNFSWSDYGQQKVEFRQRN